MWRCYGSVLSGMRLPASQEDDSGVKGHDHAGKRVPEPGRERDKTREFSDELAANAGGKWCDRLNCSGRNISGRTASVTHVAFGAGFVLKSLMTGLVTGTHHDTEIFNLITDHKVILKNG